MKSVIKLLHVPPSTNSLYANVRGKGRVKTARYRTWLQAAGWDLLRQRPQAWKEPVYLTVVIGKLRAGSDVSNRIKALEDLLVEHLVIPGDTTEWVKGVNISMAPEPFEGVEVIITPAAFPLSRAA